MSIGRDGSVLTFEGKKLAAGLQYGSSDGLVIICSYFLCSYCYIGLGHEFNSCYFLRYSRTEFVIYRVENSFSAK